jgi:uncharacterized protein YcnI
MPSHRRVAARATLATILATGLAGPALAHATLEAGQAPAGSYYKAVARIGHGCDGSPTLKVRIRMPEGVTAVKPQPKAGWELATVKGKLATPVADSHGNTITEGVTEVAWTGRLLDEHYDEFVVRLKLPDRPGETVYFPIVQECEQGAHRWIEIPKPGQDPDALKEPAPGVRLQPKG